MASGTAVFSGFGKTLVVLVIMAKVDAEVLVAAAILTSIIGAAVFDPSVVVALIEIVDIAVVNIKVVGAATVDVGGKYDRHTRDLNAIVGKDEALSYGKILRSGARNGNWRAGF